MFAHRTSGLNLHGRNRGDKKQSKGIALEAYPPARYALTIDDVGKFSTDKSSSHTYIIYDSNCSLIPI